MIFQDSDHSVRIINSCLMYVFWALQWQLWWWEVSTKKPPGLWLAIWPWPSTPGETPQEQQAPEEDQSDRQRTLRPGHLSPGRQVQRSEPSRFYFHSFKNFVSFLFHFYTVLSILITHEKFLIKVNQIFAALSWENISMSDQFWFVWE